MNERPTLFHACYQVEPEASVGQPRLQLNLVVSTPTGEVSGQAHLTQAVNPPIDVTLPVAGHGHQADPPMGNIIQVEGSRPGASVAAILFLDEGWEKGNGAVRYYANNKYGSFQGLASTIECASM